MDVEYEDASLQRLEEDLHFTAGYEVAIVKAFRKRIQFTRNAPDERPFRAMKSLHYEKLKGDREGQYSMRLNDQWRLLLRYRSTDAGKLVVILSIADYH